MVQIVSQRTLRDTPEPLRPYVFHGADFEKTTTKEVNGFCPICKAETKRKRMGGLYVNTEKGVWKCVHCEKGGNISDFQRNLYQSYKPLTEATHYEKLSELKPPCTPDALKAAGLVWDNFLDRWLIPYYDGDGRFKSVRAWKPPTGKIYTTPGDKQTLWNVQALTGKDTLYLTEGEWDAIALAPLLERNEGVISSPGAHFQPRWSPYFSDRKVYLLYDNDKAGETAAKNAAFVLQGSARSVHVIKWPPDWKTGYDVRDYVKENLELDVEPKQILEGLRFLSVVPETGYSPLSNGKLEKPLYKPLPDKRPTYSQILKEVQETYAFGDPQVYDTLAVIYGTIWSNYISGDPVWMFIVGPSGCGKTTFVATASRAHVVKFQSSLSPGGLVSGFKPKDGSDPSLIAQILGKTLIVKDFTEVLDEPEQVRDRIIAILRGGFDGRIDRDYGNGVSRKYEGFFSVVAAVTDKIHSIQRADLGERFLKYQMLSTRRQQFAFREQILAAVRATTSQHDVDHYIREMVREHFNHLPDAIPEVPTWLIDKVSPLADLVEAMRGKVVRSGALVSHPPSGGVGTRVAKQLVKLAQGISLAWGKRAIPRSVYPILRKCALDTAFGWQSEIITHLLSHGVQTITEVRKALGMPRSTCEVRLKDLRYLGIVSEIELPPEDRGSGGRARQSQIAYDIVPEVRKLWKEIADK